MNKLTLLLIALSFTVNVNAKAPHPEEENNGIYTQELFNDFGYQVDTVTQLCFANNPQYKMGGVTRIDCQNLFLRDEWKSIITWLKK